MAIFVNLPKVSFLPDFRKLLLVPTTCGFQGAFDAPPLILLSFRSPRCRQIVLTKIRGSPLLAITSEPVDHLIGMLTGDPKERMDVSIVKHKTYTKVLVGAALLVACAMSSNSRAHAALLPDIDPEIASSVWEEDAQTCASVSLNGKDLVTYKGTVNGRTAEQRAEELADKLKDVVNDTRLDATKLVPSRDNDIACIKIDGNTILKFDALSSDNKNPLEQSFKVVNSLRFAMGAMPIPPSFLKSGDLSSKELLAGGKTKGAFSGHASWYGPHFHGKTTSDGSRYDQDGMTAAHKTLPFGTKLLVTNRSTGKSCVVEVNDRGPFVGDRVIDLSRGAARQLNMVSSGVALVDCLVLGKD